MTCKMRSKLTTVSSVFAVVACVGLSGRAMAQDWSTLNLQNAGPYSDVGGTWQESDGIISPPGAWADEHLTFFKGKAYADFEAELEFRWQANHCGAGFIVGAQNAGDFYLVDFSCCGQQFRAKHFWAAVSKMENSGWLKTLKTDMIRGVSSELGGGSNFVGPWHKARIVVAGNQIRLWVDRRPFPVVTVDGLKPGYVGLESWTYHGNPGSGFRNLRIRGTAAPAPAWDNAIAPAQNWFNPWPVGTGQQWITGLTDGGIAKCANGSLLMNIGGTLLRSADLGRTWQQVQAKGWESGSQLVGLQNGKVLAFKSTGGSMKDSEYVPGTIKRSVSEDNGDTWTPYELAQQGAWKPDRPMILHPMIGIIELKDGTLVGFHAANHPSWQLMGKGGVFEWGTIHTTGFSSRSTDQGKTWSTPVPLDGPPGAGITMDNCEYLSNIQTKNGDLLSLGRPIYSPWMWEVWSTDNAVSWGPSTRGPFCMYATASPPRATASGALIVAGRMPGGQGAYVSHDDGMTWQGYRVGTDMWAMGSMLEVKPDVVLYVYMDTRGTYARAQFLRVTPKGLEPARDMLPSK